MPATKRRYMTGDDPKGLGFLEAMLRATARVDPDLKEYPGNERYWPGAGTDGVRIPILANASYDRDRYCIGDVIALGAGVKTRRQCAGLQPIVEHWFAYHGWDYIRATRREVIKTWDNKPVLIPDKFELYEYAPTVASLLGPFGLIDAFGSDTTVQLIRPGQRVFLGEQDVS